MNPFTAAVVLAALVLLAGCGPSSTDSLTASQAATGLGTPAQDEAPVTVYYLHRSFRCDSCNAMERMTREAIRETHAQELAAGRLAFESVDFQSNEEYARRYDVNAPTVVVRWHDATAYRKLDELWGLRGDPEAFRSALAEAVNEALEKNEQVR